MIRLLRCLGAVMDSKEFELCVRQNKHRIRWWCQRNNVERVDRIDWARLFDEVSKDMALASRPPSLKASIEQAMSQARDEIMKGDTLFPPGWDRLPFIP